MPGIKYVCISDLHLGEEDSLFTHITGDDYRVDPLTPSPVMTGVAECLRSLIPARGKKPTLILNGDILELALAKTHEAAMVFERFMELLMPAAGDKLFERVIFIPGNHDHHLWELARETQYVKYKIDTNRSEILEEPYHNTRMFDPKPLASFLLTRLVKTSNRISDFNVEVAYPNFGLLTKDGAKCIMFHHGHFTESMYHLITTIVSLVFPDRAEPKTVWEIERENWAWIDFFWSAMGRSGQAGERIELIYEKRKDPEGLTDIVFGLMCALAKRGIIPDVRKMPLGEKLVRGLIHHLANRLSQTERSKADKPPSKKTKEGLKTYVGGPLREQIFEEQKHMRGSVPYDVTFVFSHTHKPFETRMGISGYSKRIKVYNTGGWVVDDVERQRVHGGAILLIDEDTNAVSLRMYNEEARDSEYRVRLQAIEGPGRKKNPLHQELESTVRLSRDPWKSFSAAAAREVKERAKALALRRRHAS